MCKASKPKAPEPTKQKTPRVLLMRNQLDDLLLAPVPAYTGRPTVGNGGILNPQAPSSPGGAVYPELRIP